MELELKTLSLTILLGLMAAILIWLTVTVARGDRIFAKLWVGLFRASGDAGGNEKEGRPLPAITTIAVLSLMVCLGITLEDLSKNALDERRPSFLDIPVRLILHLEYATRVSPLFESKKPNSNVIPPDLNCETWLGRWKYADDAKLPNAKLSSTAEEVLETLATVAIAEHRAQDKLIPIERAMLDGLEKIKCALAGGCLIPCDDLRKLNGLYYLAKNYVYGRKNLYEEAENIRHRGDFARGVVYLCTVTFFLLAVALAWRLAREGVKTFRFERKIEEEKIIAAANLAGKSIRQTDARAQATAQLRAHRWAYSRCLLVPARGRAIVVVLGIVSLCLPFEALHVSLLAFTIVFGCGCWFALRSSRTPLFSGGHAKVTTVTASVLVITTIVLFASATIYASEERNFANRMFGYYATYRALELNGDSCEKKEGHVCDN